MQIGVIGINHKSAELRFREAFAKACCRRFGPGNLAHGTLSYVLLTTCNRTELYFTAEDLAQTHIYFLNILRRDLESDFEHCLYSYFGSDCFFHLARVTAGTDSAIIGETEIQGQVKHAYEKAASYRSLSRQLHFLFQKCLKIGKEIRSKVAFGRGMPSLEEAILNTGSHLFGDLAQRRILFVGVSEINHKIFKRFKQKGLKEITFCNRSPERARQIAEKEDIALLPWSQLHTWPTFDMAIFGTKSPEFIVTPEHLACASSPTLTIDLSVPRNVDPAIGRHPHVVLLNVDQLNKAIDRKRRLKAAEVARIETTLIAHAVTRQVSLFHAKEKARLLALAV